MEATTNLEPIVHEISFLASIQTTRRRSTQSTYSVANFKRKVKIQFQYAESRSGFPESSFAVSIAIIHLQPYCETKYHFLIERPLPTGGTW